MSFVWKIAYISGQICPAFTFDCQTMKSPFFNSNFF
jgi:hypothetical protein